MSNNKIYRSKKLACQDAYLAGQTDAKDLAEMFGVTLNTIWKWRKDGGWADLAKDECKLDAQVDKARKKAILTALKEFAEDPKNIVLDSLVKLLRNEAKRTEPIKELNDYIIKFLDQTTDFFIDKGYHGLLKDYQAILFELSEYLRTRNG